LIRKVTEDLPPLPPLSRHSLRTVVRLSELDQFPVIYCFSSSLYPLLLTLSRLHRLRELISSALPAFLSAPATPAPPSDAFSFIPPSPTPRPGSATQSPTTSLRQVTPLSILHEIRVEFSKRDTQRMTLIYGWKPGLDDRRKEEERCRAYGVDHAQSSASPAKAQSKQLLFKSAAARMSQPP
jgi:hypothetical protein